VQAGGLLLQALQVALSGHARGQRLGQRRQPLLALLHLLGVALVDLRVCMARAHAHECGWHAQACGRQPHAQMRMKVVLVCEPTPVRTPNANGPEAAVADACTGVVYSSSEVRSWVAQKLCCMRG
jgi:hypothetical protein